RNALQFGRRRGRGCGCFPPNFTKRDGGGGGGARLAFFQEIVEKKFSPLEWDPEALGDSRESSPHHRGRVCLIQAAQPEDMKKFFFRFGGGLGRFCLQRGGRDPLRFVTS